MHVFNEKPLGLKLGSRKGTVYVYKIEKKPPKKPSPPPSDTQGEENNNNNNNNNSNNNNDNNNQQKKIPSKVAAKLGMDPNDMSNSRQKSSKQREVDYKIAKMRYDKLKSITGRRLLKIQEVDVTLFDLNDIVKLISKEKTPLYITFGETIDNHEELEYHHFRIELHKGFFQQMFLNPPTQYAVMDVQRMTLLFFSLFALDLLYDMDTFFDKMNKKGSDITKKSVIDWIYAQQIISQPNSDDPNKRLGGFRGGSFLGICWFYFFYFLFIFIFFSFVLKY